MRKLVKLDKIKRHNYKNIEKKNYLLKFLSYSKKLEINLRKSLFSALYLLRFGSITTIQNRCVLSGRSRGLSRRLKISRMFLKINANNVFIPGLQKQNN